MNIITSGEYLWNSNGVRNAMCCRNMGHKRVRNVDLDRYLMATFVWKFRNARLYNKWRRKMELDRTVKGNRLRLVNPWQAAFAAVPNFFYSFAPPLSLYCEEYVCIYICIYIYVYTYPTAYRSYMNYCCYQIILRVKQFYTNRDPCEVLTGYLSLWCRPGGDWANTWHWAKRFTVLFWNRKQ
jgi:hypothetical protein